MFKIYCLDKALGKDETHYAGKPVLENFCASSKLQKAVIFNDIMIIALAQGEIST